VELGNVFQTTMPVICSQGLLTNLFIYTDEKKLFCCFNACLVFFPKCRYAWFSWGATNMHTNKKERWCHRDNPHRPS